MAAATRSLRWLALAVAARAARHHHATPRFADADAVARPAAGGSGPTPRFFFVLGVEGTGHHFWTELGAKLNGGELDRLPEEARRRVDGVLTEVTSCFFSLSQPRTPRPCPGCEARQICAFRWRADPWPTGKALAVNGCSYPCGARDRGNANNLFKYTSPDFPRVARELARWSAYEPRPVVMLRDPVAAATSAHFRRHALEQAFETTAFELYQSLGLLDRQVRHVEQQFAVLVVHYEDLVARATDAGFANATGRVAAFLGHDAAALRFALAGGARERRDGEPQAKAPQPHQRRYVEYLFLLSATARDWYPRLWPDSTRYVAAAAANADPRLAPRRRRAS